MFTAVQRLTRVCSHLQPRGVCTRVITTVSTTSASALASASATNPTNTSTSTATNTPGYMRSSTTLWSCTRGFFLCACYHLIHRSIMSTEQEANKAPHTVFPTPITYGQVEIYPVALFGDNYSYIVVDTKDNTAFLVDPADPVTILNELRSRFKEYTVTHILTTHKHWDHAGGNEKIKETLHEIQVVGGAHDSVPGVTLPVKHGQTLKLSANITANIIEAPCHTSGHVLYYVNNKFLFTGDTLFIGGCGRFFEGSASQMFDNLCNKVGSLPDDTDLYVGHEYTVANLEFALWIEPDNEALQQKYRWAKQQREQKYPTIPSTIGSEKQTNPFMRVQQQSVVTRVGKLGVDNSSPTQVMHELRELKNANAHQKK